MYYFQDVQYIIDRLPNLVDSRKVAVDDFNHMDFLFGENARVLVYDDILKFFSKYKL